MKNYILVFTMMTALFAPAVQAQFEKEKAEIQSMFEKYFKAQNEEDLETSMHYIHPGSKIHPESERNLKHYFATWDLEYKHRIEEISFNSPGDADVIVEYRIKKLSGPKYRPQRVRYLADLRKHEGVWRLWAVYLLEREILEQ